MERLPDPPFNDLEELLEQSNHLTSLSDEAHDRSNRLSRQFADLSSRSDELIEHCRRLGELLPSKRRRQSDQD